MVIDVISIFGTIIGYAVSLLMIALIGRFVFDLCVNCFEMAWEAIHRPSLEKFKTKMAEKRSKSKKNGENERL